MKAKLFRELEKSLVQAIEHAQGKRSLRTTVLPRPPRELSAAQLRGLRDRVNASQAVFAHCLNVSTQLVQSWEGGRRIPTGAALRLLELARGRCGPLTYNGIRYNIYRDASDFEIADSHAG